MKGTRFKVMKNRKICAAIAVSFALAAMTGCSGKDSNSTTAATEAGTGSSEQAPGQSQEATTSAPIEIYPIKNADKMDIKHSDYVDVTGWKDVKVSADDATAPQNEIDYAVAYGYGSTLGLTQEEVIGRAVKAGDTAVFDFKGYVDGEAFEGGEATDYELLIGSGQFIDGFEDQIIGHSIGEEFDVNVTFPDPYPNNPDLAGAPAKFVCKVNKIMGFDNVSDDTIKTKTDGAFDTKAAYEASLIEDVTEKYRENAIWKAVMDSIKRIKQNDDLVEEYNSFNLNYASALGAQYGMTLDMVLQYYQFDSKDAFIESLRDRAQEYSYQICAVLAIADSEGITVTEDEIKDKYTDALEEYGNDEAAMNEAGLTKDGFLYDCLMDKVEELVYDTITVE